ncbi:MAG: 3-isopropylmalate dehydratase [Gammaproteobacteria bacterium]|nr:3-isopropylmalate dehydratase [Gammaproteobacteria bacterium]MBU2138481.1 3-isopropylmalate dehydratase [Gammaproteobacteria bacterium]MBU2324813.1 3-isopropylmalate dehydratase [Gammaproteobacteria bacterium]
MRLIHTLWPMLLLAGCSSFKADPEHITQVPADRVLAYQAPVTGGGQVVVNRDLGMLGGGCYVAVLVDRQVAARIGIGEEVTLQVPAGKRVVGIGVDEADDTLCGKGRLRKEIAVPIVSGQTQHVRIVSQSQGGFNLRLEAP